AGALEEIVAAALEPVEAVFVPPVDVAGGHPAVVDQLRGPVGLVEVIGNGAAAFHLELAAACVLDDFAFLVADLYLIPVERQAGAARPTATGEIVDEAMQQLRGAEPFQDVDATHFLPVVPGRDWQDLARRDAET